MATQKQKMLAGEAYNANDAELIADMMRAQELFEQFNAFAAADRAGRRAVLEELLGAVGDDAVIRPSFRCDYGRHIRIGARTFVNFNCVFLDCNTIDIGAEVQIAPGVHIYTATHPLDATARRSGLESALPVTIADGVWLGGGAIICPGVTIGENTIVGAGSIVTRDLPPGVLAVGNPARVVRVL